MSLATVVAALARQDATLLRAWPRSAVHLQLQAEIAGRPVAGQWFAGERDAARAHAGTRGSVLIDRHLLLQDHGVDRRLPGLAALVAEPGARLVAHRPERRGVVRREGGGAAVFTKVVRPAALPGVVAAASAAEALPLRTPAIVDVDTAASAVTTSAVPGVTLHELLATPEAVQACHATGQALAALHAVAVPPGTAVHGAAEEAAVLARWAERAREHGLTVPELGPPALPGTEKLVLLHRDLHDKQVLVDAAGAVGVLDFDLLAAGDPALDLGNLLAHLDLRVAQGLLGDARPLREAVLEGYQPSAAVLSRVAPHEQATRLRLAAVYAFRPRWSAAAASLVARMRVPSSGSHPAGPRDRAQ